MDGAPAAIHRVNYLMRAVALSAGVHRVRFAYALRALAAGIQISLAAAPFGPAPRGMGSVANGGIAAGSARVSRRGFRSGSGGHAVKALIIIPTYDERENLVELLAPEIFAQNLPTDVPDRGRQFPRRHGHARRTRSPPTIRGSTSMHRAGKMGLGSAYVAGFRWALERDYEAVFEMDADFSHNPDSLREFLRELETADLVLGSRYLHGVTVVNWPLSRLILSYSANVLQPRSSPACWSRT